MTIAFAALSTTLRIGGTASVPGTTWNIHFQNWAVDTASTVTVGSNIQQNTAVYPSVNELQMSLKPNVTKVENLNVTLYQPGDYAKYTFQIINEGTIDADLQNFSHNLTCASSDDCSHLSYTVECKDSNTINGNNVLIDHSLLAKNGGVAYCSLEVKYLDQTNTNSNTAGTAQTYSKSAAHATLDATWVYVQKVDSPSGNEPVTPSNPYETTFDETYTYADLNVWRNTSDISATSLDSSWSVYLRRNTSTSLVETCRVYPSGAVCLTNNLNGYSSDFEDVTTSDTHYNLSDINTSGLKGYTLAKAEEMLSKGASYCTVDSYDLHCYMPIVGYCRISTFGGAYCGGGGTGCDIGSGGVYNCY